MRKIILLIFVFLISAIKVCAYSEIDNIASIEATSKTDYKKIDNEYYLKGLNFLEKNILNENDKDVYNKILELYKKENFFEALSLTEDLENIDDKKILKGVIYASIGMMNSAYDLLKDIENPEIEYFKNEIVSENRYEVFPYYELLSQNLSDEYDLDYHKTGIKISKNFKDSNIVLDYKILGYTSSNKNYDKCITNIIGLSSEGHINPKLEYKVSISGKFYELTGKGLLLGNAGIKYHPKDDVMFRFLVTRDNMEQSYITAVGANINNSFTGLTTNNRIILEANKKFKKNFYSSIRFVGGVIDGQNIPDNYFLSGYLNIGKRLYSNPLNPYIQKIDFDLMTYNSSFRKNLLHLEFANGISAGGYFSPKYYNAATANIRFEGIYKKLSYGLKAFAGEQISTDEHRMSLAFGVSPYLKFLITERLDFKVTYTFSEFADIKSHFFAIGLIFKI